MAFNSRRIGLALIIILCVTAVTFALIWLVIAPKVIETKANEALEKIAEKTHRHVEISDISLNGLTHVGIGRLTVSDVNQPEKTAISIDDIEIRLSAIPTGDFSVASIDIGEFETTLRIADGKTNFDDVLDLLKAKKKSKDGDSADPNDETEKKPSAWKRYVTPFPQVHVSNVSVTMPTMPLTPSIEIGAVSASEISVGQNSEGRFTISGDISALIVEDEHPETYAMHISGAVKNAKDGSVSITMPRSENGNPPAFFQSQNGDLTFDTISITLPTTVNVTQFDVTQGSRNFIHIDNARARLMTLPPKKVSGVYFKEIELTNPQIHDFVHEHGSAIYDWARTLKNKIAGQRGDELEVQNKNIVEEKRDQAMQAAIQAGVKAIAENSENPAEDIAVAVIEEMKPKVNPKDYFFSQRFFITNGTVILDDQITGLASTAIDQLNLEVGYRSIRKVVEYDIRFHAYDPIVSNISLGGIYNLPAEHLHGNFKMEPAKTSERFKTAQLKLYEKANAEPEQTNLIERLLPSLDFDKAIFDASLEYDYAQKTGDLRLMPKASIHDLTWHAEKLSTEPTIFDGSIAMTLSTNISNREFKIEDFRIESHGSELNVSVQLDKREKKAKERKPSSDPVKKRKSAKPPAPEAPEMAWYFNVSADLPAQDMDSLFQSIPHAFRTELDGLTWTGTLALRFKANGFFSEISEAKHTFDIIPSPDFAVTEWPVERDLNGLNDGFVYAVQDPNALQPHDIVIPPSIYPIVINNLTVYEPRYTADDIRERYPNWVLFDDLNPWLVQLITTTEDGSFFTHEGFSSLQIKAAIEKNLSKQAFTRGASTLSMQLIKNLYFNRNKTISRKLQEAIYTWMMESVMKIPKKRIMELYFNIIEFGPEIYGIEEAAKYYFGKRSRDLSLRECAYIISIIPSPRKGESYRLQATLNRSLQKTISYYIESMYRRKCDPEVLERMRTRFEKMGQEVPFEPCCPDRGSLQLMLDSDELAFYVPNRAVPTQYEYNPELYTENGEPLVPMGTMSCGSRGNSGGADAVESIFETLDSEEIPSKLFME